MTTREHLIIQKHLGPVVNEINQLESDIETSRRVYTHDAETIARLVTLLEALYAKKYILRNVLEQRYDMFEFAIAKTVDCRAVLTVSRFSPGVGMRGGRREMSRLALVGKPEWTVCRFPCASNPRLTVPRDCIANGINTLDNSIDLSAVANWFSLYNVSMATAEPVTPIRHLTVCVFGIKY